MYKLSNESGISNVNYDAFCVYDEKDSLMATVIVLGRSDKDKGRLFEIHLVNRQCSIDNVVEAVKKEGINVDSFLVIKMPCRA